MVNEFAPKRMLKVELELELDTIDRIKELAGNRHRALEKWIAKVVEKAVIDADKAKSSDQ